MLPSDLRPAAGASEVSVSLGTPSRRIAVRLSLSLRVLAISLVARFRLGDPLQSDDFKRELDRAKAAVQGLMQREVHEEELFEVHCERAKDA